MALIGNISGSSNSVSRIGITGSVIVADATASTFPSFPGSDVIFFVSGSKQTSNDKKSSFGGDLIVSGSLSALSGTVLLGDVTEITGDELVVSASLLVSGTTTMNGDLIVTGSLYTTSGAEFAGSGLEVSGSLIVSGPVSFDGQMRSVSAIGSDVYFYVSGSKDGKDVTVFDGNVRVSGTLSIGTASVTITSNDVQFGNFATRIQRAGNNLVFYDGNNPGGLTLQQIGYPTQFFESTTAGSIYTTGSLSLTGQEGITAPSQKGSDVTFYVSGSIHNVDDLVTGSAEGVSLFGGSVVVSGSMVLSGSLVQGENITFYPQYGYPAGKYVQAIGNNVSPLGNYVVTHGVDGLLAIGDYSHAEGDGTFTDGYATHAEGQYSYATGSWSHAEGYAATSAGVWSHAEGYITTAHGSGSHAEGNRSQARADYSHAEGYNGNSHGIYSHAEGVSASAIGSGSHAEGYATFAYGDYAHSEGYVGNASGAYSHTEGINSYAYADGAHAEGFVTLAYGYCSHTEGALGRTYGNYSHAEGYLTIASGSYSHAEGQQTVASGSFSHAEGNNTVAVGAFTHTEGLQTIATGNYSHAEGYATVAIGLYAHAEGQGTVASGNISHAEGLSTQAIGLGSHSEGYFTVASGSYSRAQGFYTITSGSYQSAVGKANKRGNTTSLFVVGNGTGDADANRSDIFKVEQNTVQVTGSFITSGSVTATAGLSGSLTKLANGTSYLIAGSGMNVVSASNGAVTLSTVVPPAPVLASYSSATTQSALSANTAYYVKYDTTEVSQGGIALQSNGAGDNTRISVPESGIYEFQYSAQLDQSVGTSNIISFWLTKNRESGGGNIPRTNSYIELGGSALSNFPFLSVFLTLTAGDYIELAWSSDGSGNSLKAIGTQSSPSRPENPSIIINIKKISV